MDGAPVEKEEVEEKAATNLIDADNLIEISLKWNVHMKLSYDAGFHKCTYVVFVQDPTDIIFLKYSSQRPQPARSLLRISEVFVLYSRLLADFLSHLGKWVKLIKFAAENECFCTWKVEKPQYTTSTP